MAIDGPRARCFQLHERGQRCQLAGQYEQAAIWWEEAALCALTREGAAVLRQLAVEARLAAGFFSAKSLPEGQTTEANGDGAEYGGGSESLFSILPARFSRG